MRSGTGILPVGNMISKQQLRRESLARRDSQTGREIAEKSARIAERLRALREYEAAGTILFYASFRSEVATSGMIRGALDDGRAVCLPRVDGGALVIYRVKHPETDLAPGLWDIPEPVRERCEETAPGEIDLAVVPGAAYDRTGNRLGFGGGYYDRFLPRLRAGVARVAVAFGLQVVGEVPAGEHDQKVDIIVTEGEIIRCS